MKIAFNTANLVARVTDYKFELKNWGAQATKTVEQTDEMAFRDICREIKAAGYNAVELWEAHIDPLVMNGERAQIWKQVLDENGLQIVAYAGGVRPESIEVCRLLGIPQICGGLRIPLDEATKLCRESGIAFNYENHPEKSVEEILAKIEGGNDVIGLAVDTGWLGTQGVDAPQAIRALSSRVRHVHVKDVKAPGGHETCLLGQGVVDIPGVFAALKEMGYDGWYSWEDEPEDRNPMDSARANREYIEKLLSQ
ncbi:MAG TPA: sugar phosphate isomerase/epimerase family protein [Abditibacteriaceae bacterium]